MPLAEPTPFPPLEPPQVCTQGHGQRQQFTPVLLPPYPSDDLNEVSSQDLPRGHTVLPEELDYQPLLFAQEVIHHDKTLGAQRWGAALPPGPSALSGGEHWKR